MKAMTTVHSGAVALTIDAVLLEISRCAKPSSTPGAAAERRASSIPRAAHVRSAAQECSARSRAPPSRMNRSTTTAPTSRRPAEIANGPVLSSAMATHRKVEPQKPTRAA